LAGTPLFSQDRGQLGVVGIEAQAQQMQLVEALLGTTDSLDLSIDHGVDLDAHDEAWSRGAGCTTAGGDELSRAGERVVVGDGHQGRAPGPHLLVELQGLEDAVRARGVGVQVDRVAPQRGHTSMMRLMRSML
jgi:hypothetical protein